jgi:hypothetical protein
VSIRCHAEEKKREREREREREKKKEEKMPPQFVDVPFDLDVSISFFRETHPWK